MVIKVVGAPPKPVAEEELEVCQVLVDDLEPYPNNPRKNDAAVPRMVEAIKEFGFRAPILIEGVTIVDGHLRVKAAKQLGMEYVPAIDVGSMPEAKVRQLRILMNKSVEWADWDNEALAAEFKFIADQEYDLAFTGFTDDIIKKIMEPNPGPKSQSADAGTGTNPEHVTISFQVTAQERELVKDALNMLMVKGEATNRSKALVALCKGVL